MLGVSSESAIKNMRAFFNAITRGDLDEVNRLSENKEIRENITTNDHLASYYANHACSNNLSVFNCLFEIEWLRDIIINPDFSVIAFVAMRGSLDILNRLLEFSSIRDSVASYDNQAFCLAAQHGHLAVMNRLLELKAVQDNITAANNNALCSASLCGHIAVVNRLLEFPAVQMSLVFEALNGNNSFCWAARNGHLDVVNRLLEFPEVKANSATDNNAALRWAHANHHDAVVSRLMEIEEVRAAVLTADNVDANLRSIAQNPESSMRALNLQEQGIVSALEKLYPDLDSKKELKSLRIHLEKHCKTKRRHLIYSRRNVEGQLLDKHHQAWRYLFARPNPWMSPEAHFVEVTEKGRQASIAPKDWHLLALIWRALNDEKIELLNQDNRDLISNNTILMENGKKKRASVEDVFSNLRESFVLTIALLSRAHNYDGNEVDDCDFDKPSCSLGVTQRLLTATAGLAISDNPDTRPIGADYLAARFKEQLITHEAKGLLPKLKSLSHEELIQLNELLDKFIMENDASVQEILSSTLALEPKEVDAFIEEAKNYYGELRFLALHNLFYQGTVYKDAETLIRGLAAHPHIAFANEVFQFVEQALALKAKQQNEADTGAVMLKTNVLQFSETESSNASRRNPGRTSKKRKREEVFGEDRFGEDRQEEDNPKKKRRIG